MPKGKLFSGMKVLSAIAACRALWVGNAKSTWFHWKTSLNLPQAEVLREVCLADCEPTSHSENIHGTSIPVHIHHTQCHRHRQTFDNTRKTHHHRNLSRVIVILSHNLREVNSPIYVIFRIVQLPIMIINSLFFSF